MPTYEYVCKMCGYTFEELQLITEPPLTHCPRCNTDNLARAIGTGVPCLLMHAAWPRIRS